MGKKPRSKRSKKLKKRKVKSASLCRRRPTKQLTLRPPRTIGKISDALVDVAKPFLDQQSSDLETCEKIMALTMLAWNAVAMKEETGESMLAEMSGILAEQTGFSDQACAEIIAPLAMRKMKKYPNDRRIVMNVQVTEMEGDRFHVTATSMDRG